jgi:hypothetical protein
MTVAFLEFIATRIANSSSKNAVSFSSARAMNRFSVAKRVGNPGPGK